MVVSKEVLVVDDEKFIVIVWDKVGFLYFIEDFLKFVLKLK